MEFIKELNSLRTTKLAEIQNDLNKKKLDSFIQYITKLFIDSQGAIQIAFKHYVSNNPTLTNPAIVKNYSIGANDAIGLDLFFNQEGGKNVKEFIASITDDHYKGFHITIKNITESKRTYSYFETSEHIDYKIQVRFQINFEEFEEGEREA
jgi:hypothetical protein